nr:M28 family peptidase [Candidatus Sigynarchaeota archaeon]
MINPALKDELMRLTSALSFPRRSGSSGNERARAIITSQLQEYGYKVQSEEFTYNPVPGLVLNAMIHLALIFFDFSLFLILWNNFNSVKWFQVIAAIAMIGILFVFMSIPLGFRQRFVHEKSSVPSRFARTGFNIVADAGDIGSHESDPAIVVIGAHYDSIALLFPPKLNIFVFVMNTVGVLVVAILAIFEGFWFLATGPSNVWFRLIFALLTLLVLGTLVARFFNKRSNTSNGAIDNASGCAVALLLAKECGSVQAMGFSKVRFVFFGAEEEGLWGSLFHSGAHAGEFQADYKGNVVAISIDEPGGPGKFMTSNSFGFPRIVKSPSTSTFLVLHDAIQKKAGTGIQNTWFPYPASDHASFVVKGFAGTWLSHVYVNANSRMDKLEDMDMDHMCLVFDAIAGFLKK